MTIFKKIISWYNDPTKCSKDKIVTGEDNHIVSGRLINKTTPPLSTDT